MDFKVTARKWRPQLFKEIIGQENLVKTIQNSISSGRIPHAFLFSGVRGVGKTTTARIIAKILNCRNPSGMEPCNICPSCTEITGGYSLDVIEIDGASNRGIDNIRELKDTISYMPISGKYKIYIIDEVHMLTNEASNALLKTLEEPPPHAVFILATTEAHKVIPTIKSRCQHFIFRKIAVKSIVEQLKKICRDEKIKYTEEGLFLIANAADGSLRDAETIFDQVSAYSSGDINEKNVADLLGIPDSNYFTEIIESVKRSDIIRMLKTVEKYINNEGDIKIFAMSMIRFLKEGVLIIKLPYDDELLDITQKNYDEMKTQFSDFSSEDLLRMINIFIDLYKDLKGEPGERFLLENALFKMMDYKNIVNIGDLRNEIIAFIENDRNFRSRVISHEREGDSALHETKTNDPKTAFFNLLSEDNIKRSMLKSIISAEIGREGRLSVVISDPNNLAYFEKEKKEMENELKKRTGFNLIIELQLAEDKKLETVSGVNKNPGQRAEEVEKPQIVKEIINLFDGKVQ